MRNSYKIRIGQIFRVPRGEGNRHRLMNGYASYLELTQGTHSAPADINKGIWAYRKVHELGQKFNRRPAILLHSNPFKEGTEGTPWVDIIEPDERYALYNGDNKTGSQQALASRGNSLLAQMHRFYTDPQLRPFAPPLLVFKQREVNGNRKGYREFSGYGVPTQYFLRTQWDRRRSHFSNLVIELALFTLDVENNEFDWTWIDKRRDGNCHVRDTLACAPAAWRRWVKHGESVLERCRRRVAKRRIASPAEQLDYSKEDSLLLKEVNSYYKKIRYHAFEGLASLVATRVIDGKCIRGWVTKRSGDGGIDFVCRLDLGSGFCRTPVVVLGQAKCGSNMRAVKGTDLARVVARLQRGWLGVFVTTGIFSRASQAELYQDKYPVLLINGKTVATELRKIMFEDGVSLQDLLERERGWYEQHFQPLDPIRILDDSVFGTRVGAPELQPASDREGVL